MSFYNPGEIAVMIEDSGAPRMGSPEVGLLVATRAQAAATLLLAETMNEILVELQYKRNGGQWP